MKILKILLVFLSLIAVIAGLTLLIVPNASDDRPIGGILLAGGLTYLWYRTGFRGLS
jgi:hypothetical protein